TEVVLGDLGEVRLVADPVLVRYGNEQFLAPVLDADTGIGRQAGELRQEKKNFDPLSSSIRHSMRTGGWEGPTLALAQPLGAGARAATGDCRRPGAGRRRACWSW